jgi:hypothetical protein
MTYSSEPTFNTAHKPTATVIDGPVGIGGWLILPILGLCGTIALTLFNLYGVVTEWAGIKAIIAGGNDSLVAMRVPLAISLILGLALVVVAAICLQRIFTYSPTVPKMMTIFYIGLIVATLGEILADNLIAQATGGATDPGNLKEFLRVCVSAAIWIPYFHRSRRVANTFRNREAAVDRKIGEVF